MSRALLMLLASFGGWVITPKKSLWALLHTNDIKVVLFQVRMKCAVELRQTPGKFLCRVT